MAGFLCPVVSREQEVEKENQELRQKIEELQVRICINSHWDFVDMISSMVYSTIMCYILVSVLITGINTAS